MRCVVVGVVGGGGVGGGGVVGSVGVGSGGVGGVGGGGDRRPTPPTGSTQADASGGWKDVVEIDFTEFFLPSFHGRH